MEKKIERVPYISKWYKEELDWSQLFKFDFKDEPMTEETAKELNDCFKNTHVYFDAGSDWDVDNVTTTVNYNKPTSPTLKFEHHLTQQDVSYLRELLHLVYIDIESIKHVPSKEKYALDKLTIINNYISNSLGVRDKAHEKQLEELIEQSKHKKSYEGTLGEHWKELMDLFDIKSKHGLKSFKNIDKNCLIIFSNDCDSTNKLYSVFNKLGIDFIKDFVKVCEKCED